MYELYVVLGLEPKAKPSMLLALQHFDSCVDRVVLYEHRLYYLNVYLLHSYICNIDNIHKAKTKCFMGQRDSKVPYGG